MPRRFTCPPREGMTITYALMEAFEKVAAEQSERATLVNKARVVRLLGDKAGITGVEYDPQPPTHNPPFSSPRGTRPLCRQDIFQGVV